MKKSTYLNTFTLLKKTAFLFIILSMSVITFSSCGSDSDDDDDSGITPPPTEVAKGETGKLSWLLTSDGALTLSGEGKMPSYENATTPWDAYRSSIKSIVLEKGITSIGKEAFKDYTALEKVTLPQTIDSIHTQAFAGTGITDLILFEGTEYIDEKAFAGCTSLQNVKFPGTLICILDSAFAGCTSLKNFTLPDKLEMICADAFAGCTSLTQITYPAGLDYFISGANNFVVGCSNLQAINVDAGNKRFMSIDGVFYHRSEKYLLAYPGGKTGSYTIPEGVSLIMPRVFEKCSKLTAVTLPESLVTIHHDAFNECTGLTEIVIPANTKTIATKAFLNCSNLKKVTCLAVTPPTLRDNNFSAQDDILYVPAASLSAYKADAAWSAAFSDIRAL